MVSPSKTKYSRVAANQQQKTASTNKVKLVKGPRPLIHHRFYLDIQRYQLANEIETTIKELGGQIEFFLNKEITHFITDKDYQPNPNQRKGPESDGGNASQQLLQQQRPATPTTPQTPRTPLSYVYHPHRQQYVNEASPSSPCLVGTPNSTQPGLAHLASGSAAVKPPIPRSRADAMLQRVRQQQQQYHSNNNPSSAPPSPCSPAPGNNNPAFRSNNQQSDRLQQSPAHLAKSWGKPIWTTEYAIKFFKKVVETCSANREHTLPSLSKTAPTTSSSSEAARKSTNIQHLRGDFIKIESFHRHHRPAFQLFKKWPVLNLNARSSASPFNSNNRDRDRDRDRKSNQPKVATAAVTTAANTTTTTNQTNARTKPTQQQQQRCGYCEICRIEYDVLANHLAAEEHSAFVKNDDNFVTLDKLIGEGGVDLKTFLERNPAPELEEEEEEGENKEEPIVGKKEPSEQVRLDAERGPIEVEENKEDRVVECEERVRSEVKEETKDLRKEDLEENGRTIQSDKRSDRELPKAIRTYSRKPRGKSHLLAPENHAEPHASSAITPPVKRTYAAGRKQARRAAALAAAAATSAIFVPSTPEFSPKPPANDKRSAPLSDQEKVAAPSISTTVDDAPPPPPPESSNSNEVPEVQMFGRRSAIYHHPHNTLNHHNHQKVKTARQLQQQLILGGNVNIDNEAVSIPSSTQGLVPEALSVEEMKVLNNEPIKNGPSEKEKERQSKRSAADRMGLKGSTLKPNEVHHPSVEMLECEGLDPKNTKRISLGLRQNPKRANLNEDFTSLLDETLGPMRKSRARRESVKRINYSEPREDEIVSQEEIMQSILEKTAIEASENTAKRKKPGSPKRPLDVKIRGIQWRAPSPQARPPVKSPLLYQVIEEPKPPKNKKTASPTKGSKEGGGSPSKSNKNGLIVKIRRVRQSELSLLNDEAENFMFPKKDDSSDEETDEDRQTTSELTPGEVSQELPSSELDHRNSISMRKSSGTPVVGGGGRKRTSSTKLPPPDSPSKKAAKETENEATPRSRRGAVRGPAALLQDNAEYYKFPDPGSRLRFPEAPIQPSPTTIEDVDVDDNAGDGESKPPRKRGMKRCRSKTPAPATMTSQKQQEHDILLATRSSPSSPYHHQEQLLNCGKTIINYVKGKEDGMGVFRWSNFRKNCKDIEPYRFAFERVPSLEPWYETFQRQDDCSEQVYEYFGNTAYRKLPYEMGTLPPLKQNCCILNYRIKSGTPETTVPVSSTSTTSSSSSSSGCSTNSKCNHNGKATTTVSSAAATTIVSATVTVPDDKEPLALPLKKRKLLVDSDRPRKSPREHASTLAILSLLHQQQQHNRRRTISSGSSSVPIVTTNLPPPSPTPSAYSPKKAAIQAHHNSQQEADSALGDEIPSSCGSDPVTEKEDHCAKKIKFDPPVIVDNFVNYKVMCQELDSFLDEMSEDARFEEDVPLIQLKKKTVPIGVQVRQPLRKNLNDIFRACDKEAPLSLKQVNRREGAVRKIVQYDRKPRPLSAVSIKSFDGGGSLDWAGRTVLFRKRINRTGWPNVKKRIVTRKQQQLLVKKDDGTNEVKADGDADGSRKSSTEESQISGLTADSSLVKQEDEDGEEDDDDEFEDTMTMLDDEEPTEKIDTLLTEEDEEIVPQVEKKVDRSKTPVPCKVEEVRSASRLEGSTRVLSSSRYVTKTTTTMTRVDYNVPASSSVASLVANSVEEQLLVQNNTSVKTNKSTNSTSLPAPVVTEDDDKECDSISSRSIFVSDDCDTTSSTLINMQCTDDPTPIGPESQRDSASPQPLSITAEESSVNNRPTSRARQNNSRHIVSNHNPIVCIEKLKCPPITVMRTRSSSRTPIKKTYKRSIFTSAMVNSSGKPLKKKRKKKHKVNGVISSGASNTGSPSPSCSDEQNSASSSLDCEDINRDTPTPPRKSIKDRPPTPSPVKFSPRKLRKPRGRWYRER